MRIGVEPHSYDWIDEWAKIPDTESARTGKAHHDVVATEAGEVIAFHQADPTTLVFDRDGNLVRTWNNGLISAHGMVLVKEGVTEYLWVADARSPQVVKTDLDGNIVMSLQQPDIEAYRDGTYAPTSVAVDEERHGGNGDIWVTDGYGEFYIHRFGKTGDYIGGFNGEEAHTGALNNPHGIWIDRRKPEPELYIADRGQARIVVYDLEGNAKRAFGSDLVTSPCGFITEGDLLMVPELGGSRLTFFDTGDNLACYLGENKGANKIESFPDFPPDRHEPGKFISPHGMASDVDGNLYVSEFIVGGRITKLVKR